jgi:Domain of unknown function (DUF4390)
MPCFDAVCQLFGRRTKRRPGAAPALLTLLALVVVLCGAALPARAQGVEVLELKAQRDEGGIALDYQLRVTLPPAVEAAALRGVPLYFSAQASLWRPRWYWRDDRFAIVRRDWRLSYQPLTTNWRVSQGGLGQSFASLPEALAAMARSSAWRLTETRDSELEARAYIEFSWRLDTSQLPRPMQIGLGGIGGPGEWSLGVERTLRLGADAAK